MLSGLSGTAFDNPGQPGNVTFDIFANRSFKALSVQKVRRIVPFDVALQDPQDFSQRDVYTWIQKALDAGKRPIVSFELCLGSRVDPTTGATIDCKQYLPSVAEYANAVDAFLRRWPQITDYTAWNEPNNSGRQPTSFVRGDDPVAPYDPNLSGAERAGQYWNELRRQCAARTTNKCNVAAGDFLDSKMAAATTGGTDGRKFLQQYRAGMNYRRPALWAWHAYSDGEATARLDPDKTPNFTRLRRFIKATRSTRSGVTSPPVWLTEQGAVRKVVGASGRTTRHTEKVQAKIARHLVKAPSVSTRIKRFYYYHLRGDDKFDTALLRQNSSRRPVFYVYKRKTNP